MEEEGGGGRRGGVAGGVEVGVSALLEETTREDEKMVRNAARTATYPSIPRENEIEKGRKGTRC